MSRHKLWILMDELKRSSFLKNEIKKFLLKSIKQNKYASYTKRLQANYYLTNLPRISTRTQINQRCVVTGRVFGIKSKTKYSRFVFRNEAYKSNIPGCRKASW